MTKPVEITQEELALILDALEDAAYYRDTRSRVLKSAVKRGERRSPSAPMDTAGATDMHKRQARAYTELAIKLKAER